MIRPEELRDMEEAATEYATDVFRSRPFPGATEETYPAILQAIGQAWMSGFCIGRDGKTWRAKMLKERAAKEVKPCPE